MLELELVDLGVETVGLRPATAAELSAVLDVNASCFAEMAVNVHRHTSFWLLLLAYAGYAAGMRVTFV